MRRLQSAVGTIKNQAQDADRSLPSPEPQSKASKNHLGSSLIRPIGCVPQSNRLIAS